MKTYRLFFFLLPFIFTPGCYGQPKNENNTQYDSTKRVGGECEAGYCDLMYFGMPGLIDNTDTSAGWHEKGQKMIITGTAYQIDGKTPARDVIIYYHHTDNNGYYSPGNKKAEDQTRHGHIRGWVKTDANGRYTIYTIRPAPYPNLSQPAHVHWLIKEPDVINEYWTDDLMFEDDELLRPFIKTHRSGNLGGSGIVQVLMKDSIQIAEHDFILGLNILNYPKTAANTIQSGLNIGEGQTSFDPTHAYGPDKGSHACPVCKYGYYHGILYFVGNNPNWEEIKTWLRFLEQESINRQKFLKVYFVYGSDRSYSVQNRNTELEELGKELNIKYTALTYVPSFSDTESNVHLSRIDQEAGNTFIIYRRRKIIDKYIDLEPTQDNFKLISEILERSKGDYFELPETKHE